MSINNSSVTQEWIVAQGKSSSLIEQDIQRIEDETGQTVKRLDTDWTQHMRAGVIARLHIRRWRGKTRLDAKDLGIDTEHSQSLNDLMSLGEKMLMPKVTLRKLDNLDSKARTRLGNASYTTYWGQFVPVTAYQDVKNDLDQLEREYFALRDEILASYDGWVEQMRSQYRRAARMAYQRLAQVAPASLGDQTEEQFVVNLVTSILNRIPSKGQIQDSFGFELELYYIPLPSLLAEDAAKAQNIRIQTDLSIEEAQAQARLRREREWAENQKIQAEVRASQSAADVKVQMMEAMNRDIVESARKQKEQLVNGFMADIRGQLTGLIFDTCRDVLAKLQGKDGMHARTVVQVKNMIQQIEKLNFFDDADAAQMIQQLRESVILPDSSARDLGQVQNQLAAIVTLTRQTLLDLGERPASTRSLGISDMPTPDGIQMARRTLNLNTEIQGVDLGLADRGRFVSPDAEVA